MLNQMSSAVYYGGTFLSGDTPIFTKPAFEYQNTTMQVPFGEFSILSEWFAGRLKPIDAIVLLQINHDSTWANGRTKWISGRGLADAIHASHRYIREVLKRLDAWLTRLKNGLKGVIYELRHHNCANDDVPPDKYGAPLKFAVPYGKGGPIERMNAGDISWKACLVWIALKFHSDWQTGENNGITDPMTMERLAELTGVGKQTVCDAIKELQKAGMLERLSKPWKASVFQLYPKPIPKTEAERQREKHERTKVKVGRWEVVTTPHHVYSGNKNWRCRYIDGRWEKRVGHGNWKLVPDRELHRIPKAVIRDIEPYIEARRETIKQFGSLDTAQGSCHTAQGGIDSAQGDFQAPPAPMPAIG